jgi:hypothetical protein
MPPNLIVPIVIQNKNDILPVSVTGLHGAGGLIATHKRQRSWELWDL